MNLFTDILQPRFHNNESTKYLLLVDMASGALTSGCRVPSTLFPKTQPPFGINNLDFKITDFASTSHTVLGWLAFRGYQGRWKYSSTSEQIISALREELR